jgi:hypothetical protein
MRRDNDNLVVESEDDFEGWDILSVSDYKPNVVQVYMRKVGYGVGEFIIAYSYIKFLPKEWFNKVRIGQVGRMPGPEDIALCDGGHDPVEKPNDNRSR